MYSVREGLLEDVKAQRKDLWIDSQAEHLVVEVLEESVNSDCCQLALIMVQWETEVWP